MLSLEWFKLKNVHSTLPVFLYALAYLKKDDLHSNGTNFS
ncbi:hypothetical protein RV02_GL001998 [Enterococcus gilvus]|nr:hypothetical protein RV02_GL001998 [Enterococcus gilvus]